MRIGSREIARGLPAYIIAEAGTSHMGSVARAIRLAEAAKEAGADAIKFQMFVLREELFCGLQNDHKRWAFWNKSVLKPMESWGEVREICKDIGIDFGASVFQHSAVNLLKSLDPDFYKVASRAANRFPYYKVPGPFFVSNGMGIKRQLPEKSILMSCVSKYPTPLSEAIWNQNCPGLSDHSGTPWPAIDAISKGCAAVEVHFKIPGPEWPDDQVALTKEQLKVVCEARDAISEMRPAA